MKIFHEIHGDSLHDLAIFLTERECVARGYKFLNKQTLKDKAIYPGIPDVYVRIPTHMTDSKGKSKGSYLDYIIEIETYATSASIEKKRKQFDLNSGTELIIISLRELDDWQNWFELEQRIKERLP